MKRLLALLALLIVLVSPVKAQISGAGQLSCSGATVTGTAVTSSTSNNTVLATIANTPAYAVLVQLDQTTTITGGAISFQTSGDGATNYTTAGVSQVLNPATGAQLTNPYTLVASTNQQFLVILAGASNFQVKLTTALTGTGTVTPYVTSLCAQPTLGPLTLDTLGNLLAKINVALPAGTNLLGKIGIDQTTPGTTNLVQESNLPATADTNNGTTSASTLRVTLSSDSTGQTIPAPTTASGDAVSACNILSAASTNSTNCKGSAGNFYGYEIYNTTTTIYYLRLYNASSAPTCSSATGFIRTIPIPPAGAAGQAGGAISNQVFPVNYGTGIGYCLTGGSSSTDNTNAATGVFGEIRYK